MIRQIKFKVLPIWFLKVRHCRWSFIHSRILGVYIIRLLCMELRIYYKKPENKAMSIEEFKEHLEKRRNAKV